MSALKPGTLCVIVAGCPENIGLIVEVLEHLGPYPPRDDAYHIRTVSGRHFPQLKTGPNERLARGCSREAITDRHKLRPLVEAKDESEMQIGVSSADPALCHDNSLNHESIQSNREKIMTNEMVAPFSLHPAEPLGNPKADYPHLVIRLMSAVYQREPIEIRQGVPCVHIGHRSTYIQHPSPLTPEGQVSEDCRQLLMQGVSEAVKRLKHRMCVVWKSGVCSYVEADGTITESGEPPSGGVTPPASITFDQRVPINQEDNK